LRPRRLRSGAPSWDPRPRLRPAALIREANAIKATQGDPPLKIVASAWTAPPFMKDNGDWYTPPNVASGRKGRGGSLRPEQEGAFARYLLAYLDAYRREGVEIWGMTPVNEPDGNGGHWESMEWRPAGQAAFLANHLGPLLAASEHDVRLLGFDQNRDHMETWADALFGDAEAARYLHGLAVHWYSSTVRVYEDGFDRIRSRYPEKAILHTEGCIDSLGVEAPPGVGDPEGYEESGWFGNDAFWWGPNATDWAYTATWEGVDAAEHPRYTPVHRYCRDILVGIDHGLSGWIDWNLVLDARGGPNHVGNFCGAPIMVDTATGEVHETPVFRVLEQLSRTIRPGDVAVRTEVRVLEPDDDGLWVCATLGPRGDDRVVSVQLFRPARAPASCALRIGTLQADLTLPANSLQTVQLSV
jgi:glucosylceramidase